MATEIVDICISCKKVMGKERKGMRQGVKEWNAGKEDSGRVKGICDACAKALEHPYAQATMEDLRRLPKLEDKGNSRGKRPKPE